MHATDLLKSVSQQDNNNTGYYLNVIEQSCNHLAEQLIAIQSLSEALDLRSASVNLGMLLEEILATLKTIYPDSNTIPLSCNFEPITHGDRNLLKRALLDILIFLCSIITLTDININPESQAVTQKNNSTATDVTENFWSVVFSGHPPANSRFQPFPSGWQDNKLDKALEIIHRHAGQIIYRTSTSKRFNLIIRFRALT